MTIIYRIFLEFLTLTVRITYEGDVTSTKAKIPFYFAFWVVTMLTIRISGAHYNPAISLACMLKRDNDYQFPKILGLFYIAAQFIGAILGALIAWFLTEDGGDLTVLFGSKYAYQACCLETLGSFLICLIFIILNESAENHKDPALMSMFWSLGFCTCLNMTA